MLQHDEDATVPPFIIISLILFLSCLFISLIQAKRSQPSRVVPLSSKEQEEVRTRTAAAALLRSVDTRRQGQDETVESNGLIDGREHDQDDSTNSLPKYEDDTAKEENDTDPGSEEMIEENIATTEDDQEEQASSGIRRATQADKANWNEDKASESQFGFNIYGHAASSCQECGGATVPSSFPVIKTGSDPIQSIRHIEGLPMADEALGILQNLVREFEPIVRQRGWTVQCVSEMCCCGDGDSYKPRGPNILGYCVSAGNGRTAIGIHLRLRPPGTCKSGRFYPYSNLVSTMAHELAHVQELSHNAYFYALMAELEKQREQSISTGVVLTESGFPMTFGDRLGGSRAVLGSKELKQKVAESAQARFGKRGDEQEQQDDINKELEKKKNVEGNVKRRSQGQSRADRVRVKRREARLRAAEERFKKHQD